MHLNGLMTDRNVSISCSELFAVVAKHNFQVAWCRLRRRLHPTGSSAQKFHTIPLSRLYARQNRTVIRNYYRFVKFKSKHLFVLFKVFFFNNRLPGKFSFGKRFTGMSYTNAVETNFGAISKNDPRSKIASPGSHNRRYTNCVRFSHKSVQRT